MPVLMFQPRFHEAVASGTKRQTIRPPRKRAIRVGDALSLRAWTGKPYRSKQRELRRAQCIEIRPLVIDREFSDDRMARADGFVDAAEMKAWFAATHGLPFTGTLIRWTILERTSFQNRTVQKTDQDGYQSTHRLRNSPKDFDLSFRRHTNSLLT